MFLLFGFASAVVLSFVGLLLTRSPLVLVFPAAIGLFLLADKFNL